MTAGTATPNRPETRPGPGSEPPGRDSFGHVLWAEWTKFRTVRGWVIGMMVAGLLTVLFGYLSAAGSQTGCGAGPCHFYVPVGPGGEAVTDSFYFAHRPLAGNGSITVRMTSLTGELPTAPGGRAQARNQACIRAWSRGRRPGSSSRRAPGRGRPTRRCWPVATTGCGCSTTTPTTSPARRAVLPRRRRAGCG